MGSSSSSSSSTTTTTTQIDDRVAASDNAIVIQLEGGSTLDLTDPAILDAAAIALDGFQETLSKTLDFADKERETVQRSLDLVERRTQSESANFFQDLLKWGSVIAIAGMAAHTLPKVKL